MHASVILCTYNRAESLRITLDGFRALTLPPSLEWELVVVDNNSKDGTRAVCEAFRPPFPFRYIFEPRQGKSCALNRGIAETRAPLLVLTDDDVTVDPHWLANLLDAVARHPEADFFGGPIEPSWDVPPPKWLVEHTPSLLQYVMVHYHAGPAEKEYIWQDTRPFGANLVFRRRVFEKGFQFSEEFGLKGKDPARGEETELIDRLMRDGHKGIYVPNALVRHRTAPHRMTEAYIREWYTGHGMVEVRLGQVPMGSPVFGAPRWMWRDWIQQTGRYLLTRWTRPSGDWLRAEIRMATARGMIREARRRAKGQGK